MLIILFLAFVYITNIQIIIFQYFYYCQNMEGGPLVTFSINNENNISTCQSLKKRKMTQPKQYVLAVNVLCAINNLCIFLQNIFGKVVLL